MLRGMGLCGESNASVEWVVGADFEEFFDTKVSFSYVCFILVDRSVRFHLIFKTKYEFCYFMYWRFLVDKSWD